MFLRKRKLWIGKDAKEILNSCTNSKIRVVERVSYDLAMHCVNIYRRQAHNRELKQTRTATATATQGARKRLFPYFWRLCNSAFSYRASNFLRFCQSFCCFIVSNYRRATVVVSQNDAPVLTTTQKWSNWSRTWGTTTPRSCQFHIFTCSFCLLQLV